ncbi:MAG: DNA starvation/stationary phase protection protein Dps [Gemmataceae bacterium]
MATRTSATQVELAQKNAPAVVEILNRQLANLSDLYSQTKFAHWNVRGMNFIALHKLFDQLAEDVEEAIDEFAERATALGGVARGTIRMAEANSDLDEFPSDDFSGENVVAALADRFATVANAIGEQIATVDDELDDTCTADLFTQTVRELEQAHYFLSAHLRDPA